MQEDWSPIWQPSPSRLAGSHLTAFTRLAETAFGQPLDDYHALWQASIDDPARFWSLLWDYAGVIGSKGETALIHDDDMLAARFFPDARLNYAENLLRFAKELFVVVQRVLVLLALVHRVRPWEEAAELVTTKQVDTGGNPGKPEE